MIKWHNGGRDYIRTVSVCGDYCDEWYEACKEDQTCVENWYGLNYTSSTEDCPKGSECRTFEQVRSSHQKQLGPLTNYGEPQTLYRI